MLIVLLVVSLSISAISGEKNLQQKTHHSSALNKYQSVMIYIPNCRGPYSVLYLLHGWSGSYIDWVDRSDVENIADRFCLMIVMPDGGYASWYSDSKFIPDSKYESYLTKELIPFIDSSYQTRHDRLGRGICGLSMGGYGAFRLAFKHPNLFSSCSSLSGVLRISDHPSKWSLSSVFGDPERNSEEWETNELFNIVRNVADTVAVRFDVGKDDIVLADNRQFVQHLQKLRIPFEYAEFPGTHSWKYWGEHIGEHLEFHAKNLHK